ncbi:MAG: DHH family phosphoesterase [Candidatus Bipolaricaulota bacterium]
MWATLEQIIDRLKQGRDILVIGHSQPDGDAISSVAGLVIVLERYGVRATGCIADRIPWYYHSLPGTELIATPRGLRGRAFDTTVVVDSSDLDRIGEADALLRGEPPDITLDHHRTNQGFGGLDYCDPDAAATAMIVLEIANALVPLDQELAQVLLLGIATDTGFFKYANADAQVLARAAELAGHGARLQPIASAVVEHRTLNTIKLLGRMFDTIQLREGGKLAYGWVTGEMLQETGCTDQDTEGFVGEIRALHGVEVAILFVESPEGEAHVALRSKSSLDVSEVAAALGGGGHARAAGCSLPVERLEEAIDQVVTAAAQALRASS